MTVGVVGMGPAGLRAAMLLEEAGIRVKLYEARDRVGGRLHTWTDATDGTVYEAGGEWIDSDHTRILSLMRRFELGVRPTPREARRIEYQGQVRMEDDLWPEVLEDELRLEGMARELCRDLRLPVWLNVNEVERDHQPLSEFVRKHAHSEIGRWYLTNRIRSDEGDDLDRIGLLGWLAGYVNYVDREEGAMSAYRFKGGVQRLMDSMRDTLSEQIQFGAILRKVEQAKAGVKLRFEGFDDVVDHVILTLPPLCLERVVFEPALTSRKRCAIEACEMSPIVKLVWQFDRPWWRDRGWNGFLHTDSALQQTWDSSLGDAHTLTAYVCGNQARTWVEMNDPVKAGLYVLSRSFAEANEHFTRGWFHDWISDPFARGGFSHLAPGFVLEHMAAIGMAEERVHFAGEHTSNWTGFIEGALESAERAVAETIA